MPSDYHVIAQGLAELLCQKQAAYGDSFTRAEHIIRVLYPEGIPNGKYQDALTVIRIIDKLFRIANAKDTNQEDPWLDIAGYSLLSLGRIENQKKSSGLKLHRTEPTGGAKEEPSGLHKTKEELVEMYDRAVDAFDQPDEIEKTACILTQETPSTAKPAKKSVVIDNAIVKPKVVINKSVYGDMSKIAGMPVGLEE